MLGNFKFQLLYQLVRTHVIYNISIDHHLKSMHGVASIALKVPSLASSSLASWIHCSGITLSWVCQKTYYYILKMFGILSIYFDIWIKRHAWIIIIHHRMIYHRLANQLISLGAVSMEGGFLKNRSKKTRCKELVDGFASVVHRWITWSLLQLQGLISASLGTIWAICKRLTWSPKQRG